MSKKRGEAAVCDTLHLPPTHNIYNLHPLTQHVLCIIEVRWRCVIHFIYYPPHTIYTTYTPSPSMYYVLYLAVIYYNVPLLSPSQCVAYYTTLTHSVCTTVPRSWCTTKYVTPPPSMYSYCIPGSEVWRHTWLVACIEDTWHSLTHPPSMYIGVMYY